jgi:hypothetical protein
LDFSRSSQRGPTTAKQSALIERFGLLLVEPLPGQQVVHVHEQLSRPERLHQGVVDAAGFPRHVVAAIGNE